MNAPRSMHPRVPTVGLFRQAPRAIIVELAGRVAVAERSGFSLRKGK